jgi:ribonuclease P protein component
MNTRRETFHKSERLCSRKTIAALFENGNVSYSSVFRVVWQISPLSLPFPAEVAFSIPKKVFRLAVTRNLIRRRMREAYRRNRQMLYDYLGSENIRISFIIMFRGSVIPDYETVEKATKEMLGDLIRVIKKHLGKC